MMMSGNFGEKLLTKIKIIKKKKRMVNERDSTE